MVFEELYKAYNKLVFNLALNYTQNREDAKEITQDVFISVYDNLTNFMQLAKPSTWIYRITINKSLDYIKAKKHKNALHFLTVC